MAEIVETHLHHKAILPHQLSGWNVLKKELGIVAAGDFKYWAKRPDIFPNYPIVDDDSFSSLLIFVSKIALEVEILFPESILLLLSPHSREVVINQRQILCLMCHAFMNSFAPCDFDGQQLTLVSWGGEVEKLKCFIAYLEECKSRIQGDVDWVGTNVSYSRRCFVSNNTWLTSKKSLCLVTVAEGLSDCIERAPESLHADFANEYIGGGVLHGGCVQEEIRFTICPETLVSLLLCDRMGRTDSILIRGTEQFAAYSGYGRSFRYAGKFMDTNRIVDGFRESSIVAIDAIPYFGKGEKMQYNDRNTEDEINKVQIYPWSK